MILEEFILLDQPVISIAVVQNNDVHYKVRTGLLKIGWNLDFIFLSINIYDI